MKIPIIFWAVLAAISIGLVGGFVVANSLQGNLQLLVYVAIGFAFLSWLGSGADLLGLLREMYKEQRERADLTISFEPESQDCVTSGDLFYMRDGKQDTFKRTSFRLRVRNNGGSIAERCIGRVSDVQRIDGCSCLSNTTKSLRWYPSGQTEQDINPDGDSEILELVFTDSLEAPPIDAICKVQNPEKVRVIAWISTPDNLMGGKHYGDGMCSGRFQVKVIVSSKNTSKVSKRFEIQVGSAFPDLKVKEL